MSTLYVIGTPIGNLEDITLRALKLLGSVDIILCEDTRMTKKLLARHNIGTRTLSYHTHSKLSRVDEIITMLKEGKKLALVSDAGTPAISDPGSELVSKIRSELNNEISAGSIRIEGIPGPSALTTALSISGIPCADFIFLGFLPHKKGRETLFKEIVESERTVVFYESPHRIMKTLESLEKHLSQANLEITNSNKSNLKPGNSQRKIAVCRELTKIFEEVVAGSISEVKKYFEDHPDKIRGEFVVIVGA